MKKVLKQQKFLFSFATRKEAMAWIDFIKARVETLDKEQQVSNCTQVSYKFIFGDRLVVTLWSECEEDLLKKIMPVGERLLAEPAEELFLPLAQIELSERLRQRLEDNKVDCLGDLLSQKRGDVCWNEETDAVLWKELCSVVRPYGYELGKFPKDWRVGNINHAILPVLTHLWIPTAKLNLSSQLYAILWSNFHTFYLGDVLSVTQKNFMACPGAKAQMWCEIGKMAERYGYELSSIPKDWKDQEAFQP